ncbi:cobyrinate a,c-diamide synthase [Actinophytocola oryzae]|uniref:Hydrogenobyrinate a,c-diamide synthase n=1 Tax=Actinophytocola oryzae TaxID=502181 RepID=A0A4R7W3V3_9PSEU|nr:cobyrinate a,c-diamide synthase [Actinophytocola oryzae]TDV57172.1 hydrogenobyrinic acid a,c-diamide synthase (glutamine-hydrolysing) /cobyrinate a,c-diamide synthase [Actinophytocola oryzae]
MVARVARVVVAAPASGSGKTVVATGLMAALRRAGHVVAPFKVGPDYIDPGYHTLAAGRPGRNLDPVLVGESLVGPLFAHGSAGADVAVVEGVMGLFDGRVSSGEGSTAHVAEILGAPVVLVVDTRGHSTSLAALLHGFRSWRPTTRIAGVVLNQVGSDRHETVLRAACDDVGLDVVGVLRRNAAVEVPSRHLGLVTAAEHGGAARKAVDAMATLVADGVDLAAVLALARGGPAFTPWSPARETVGRPVIAMAGGPAFTFGYAEHAELLYAAGAEVVTVDPLRDTALPEGTAGIVLPGGFPEQYAHELSANAPLRHAVARAGVPIHAECAGLLYLARSLDGRPMCGVLDADATMTDRLTLGYRDVVATHDSVVYRAGTRLTGHEFHRTAAVPAHGEPPAWRWHASDGRGSDGFVTDLVHASYVHVHPAAAPDAVARFVARCADAVMAHHTT